MLASCCRRLASWLYDDVARSVARTLRTHHRAWGTGHRASRRPLIGMKGRSGPGEGGYRDGLCLAPSSEEGGRTRIWCPRPTFVSPARHRSSFVHRRSMVGVTGVGLLEAEGLIAALGLTGGGHSPAMEAN